MKTEQAIIGVDIGTTSTKAVVFGSKGTILGLASEGYPLLQPNPGWAEQDPEEIFKALLKAIAAAVAIAKVNSDHIVGVGISTAMHSLILVDEQERPLTRCLIWADNRSHAQVERLKAGRGHEFYLRSGTPIHPMSPLSKVAWIKEEQPDIFRRAAKFISIKEYVIKKLFQQEAVDYSIASATGMFNLEKQQWDEEILSWLGISDDQLSSLVPTTERLNGIDPKYAQVMGISIHTPWVIGASDGVLANLGVGAIHERIAAVTIGTSGAIRSVTSHPKTDPQARTFCYALTDQHWVIGGATNNGGILLRWFENAVLKSQVDIGELKHDSLQQMLHAAESVPPGAEGLLCLPYFSGERAPIWNEQARGVFLGLGLHHHQGHMIRAMLEGIMLNIAWIERSLESLSGPLSEIRISGGFAQSSFLRQLLADVLGKEIVVPAVTEASAMGAALLALYSLGEMEHLSQAEEWISLTAHHEPNYSLTSFYQERLQIIQSTYAHLAKEMEALNR